MATRNRRGRNLITSQTVLGRAKIAALQSAEIAGIKNKVLDYITQAGSIQQVLSILKRFNLEQEDKKSHSIRTGLTDGKTSLKVS